jgi:hypothetical protein
MLSTARIYIAFALLLSSAATWADEKEKSPVDKRVEDSYYNLVVLESAYQSAKYCEGTDGSGFLEKWEAWSKDTMFYRNVAILSLSAVAEATGLSTEKRANVIKETLAHIRGEVSTKVPQHPGQCKDFALTLERYKSSLRNY